MERYSRLSGSSQYLAAVSNTFSVNAGSGFLNNYYDDEGWWALAWIAAYDGTGNAQYLNMSQQIFADMSGQHLRRRHLVEQEPEV